MMTRVTGVFDQKIEAQGFDKIRSIVEVDLVDGRTLVAAVGRAISRRPGQPVHARGAAREVHRLRAIDDEAGSDGAGAVGDRRRAGNAERQGIGRGALT